MLPDPFTTEDGDVILRVGPDDTFRVHKLVLSLASSVFKDLFRTAQPDNGQNGLPTIPITDPPESVDLLLRFIYPGVVPPVVTDPATLSTLLTIADKYGVPTILPVVKERLVDDEILRTDPFGVYIVARRWGFPGLAKRAARGLTLPKIMASPSSKDPQNFAGDDFFRLVWFMQKRGEEGKRMIRSYFVWSTDSLDQILCGHKLHIGVEVVDFFERLAERIVDGFEVDPCLDTERMIKIFANGPDPPSDGFCGNIDSYQEEGMGLFCPTRPSTMMESLCDLVSLLDRSSGEFLGRAMDGKFPT